MYNAVIAELHGVYKNAMVLIVLSEEFLAQPTILRTFSRGFCTSVLIDIAVVLTH